jgi:aconitate hydratase
MSIDSFKSKATISLSGGDAEIYRLDALSKAGIGDVESLPFSLRVLLENLLRSEDNNTVTKADIEALAAWDPTAKPSTEIAYRPARVVLQDFTGVPAVVDLAAMREAYAEMGGDAAKMNPIRPADLVIDHSVQVDHYGDSDAFGQNVEMEYGRNQERYQFLRWGQQAFQDLQVVPPGTGIVHQVNLEYLASAVVVRDEEGVRQAYPDTLVGTDSHTTMINGLGVLGWGVGGIEAEAAMLGQPITMLIPQVVGFKLEGALPAGATATDLVLTVVEMLRKHGCVGKFVEFYGSGMDALSLPDRATLANMAPEYGATMGFVPADAETLNYMRKSGRSDDHVNDVETYLKTQGLLRTSESKEPRFSSSISLDMAQVVPSVAGPKRPQDRIALTDLQRSWRRTLVGVLGDKLKGVDTEAFVNETDRQAGEKDGLLAKTVNIETDKGTFDLPHGAVIISAITSCTNTSNPAVMLAAGLLARNAAKRGMKAQPWVKTSLAPGSQVVTEYLNDAGLMDDFEKVGFYLVGYGCTTCIGNSGPSHENITKAATEEGMVVTSVLSGNRNFEGRVSPITLANYLASPPLVVAYSLAGTVDIDFDKHPIGQDNDGKDVYLKELWPSAKEVSDVVEASVRRSMFEERYANVFEGDKQWQGLSIPDGAVFEWKDDSTYIRKPPFFDGLNAPPEALADITGARCLAKLGKSVTTDHISPAGAIAPDSPAGKYLQDKGVAIRDFNSYGSRRGNHEVMMRGTFANIRLRNELAPGTEGSWTSHQPSGETMSIFDASMKYQAANTPLIVLAGTEYGTGSSRDWAAKGTLLLGVKAVIAQSYERIHRSNLIGMGVLPLQFADGEGSESLGLTGKEEFSITGISGGLEPGKTFSVTAGDKSFDVLCRVDTPQEVEYLKAGGILQYVLREMPK